MVLNYCNEGPSAFINTTIDISLEFRIVVLPRGFHPTRSEAVGWNGNTTILNVQALTGPGLKRDEIFLLLAGS